MERNRILLQQGPPAAWPEASRQLNEASGPASAWQQYLPPRSRDALALALRQQIGTSDWPPTDWQRRTWRRARLQMHRVGLPGRLCEAPAAIGAAIDIQRLATAFDGRLHIDGYWRCRSTQANWRRRPAPWPRLVLAESQSGGHGRHGRPWQSGLTGNLYFSLLLGLPDSPQLGLLPLLAGLAIAETLASLGIDARLKWPNDVLVDGAKIAGVLVEADLGRRPARVVIGVGLNWWLPATSRAAIGRACIDLRQCLGTAQLPDRTEVLRRLVGRLLELPAVLARGEGGDWLQRWRSRDALLGRPIELDTGTGHLSGRADSVDEQGRLLLLDASGQRQAVSSAEVCRVGGGP